MPNATPRANARTLPKATPADAEATATPPEAAEKPDLLDVSDNLTLVHDLVEAAYMAAESLEPDLGGRPLTRLLDLVSGRLKDAIDQLETIREAAQ